MYAKSQREKQMCQQQFTDKISQLTAQLYASEAHRDHISQECIEKLAMKDQEVREMAAKMQGHLQQTMVASTKADSLQDRLKTLARQVQEQQEYRERDQTKSALVEARLQAALERETIARRQAEEEAATQTR
jgi:hypothetical protein